MHAAETIPLFDSPRTVDTLDIPDADIRFMHRFLASAEAAYYFDKLTVETRWTQPLVHVWNKDYLQPRLSCWVGDSDANYRFAGRILRPLPWTQTLLGLRQSMQVLAGIEFNSVLLNLYRDGDDSIGMHSDNEPELGRQPVIASLSLGATRMFRLKHRQNASPAASVELTNGSLMIMAGRTQELWLHGIRKEKRDVGPRINLTFRRILTA